MPQRRLLHLDANRLTAYSWQGGRLELEGSFSADASANTNGARGFEQYLGEHAGSVFSMLVDVAEEGFQVEDIPHVSGKDRSALTARRLGQYFYGTPFSLAMSVGRVGSGRRDEKMLFSALTQPRIFEPWLTAIRNNGIQLAGIYSAPFALASIVGSVKPSKQSVPQQLVLSITRSGVRQSFFVNGKLIFSRLTMLATGAFEEAAIACAVEAQKTYQYLVGQRLVTRKNTLNVLVLAHPSQVTLIRSHCISSNDLNFAFADLLAEAKKVKLKNTLPDSNCELLLLHALIHNPPQQQFAPAAERHFYHLWQIRAGLTAAAAVVFVACLLYAGKQYYTSYTLNHDTEMLALEATTNQQKYDAALRSLPPIAISTESLRSLVSSFEEVTKRSPLLESTYLPLSYALDSTPGIDLQRIDWSVSDTVPPAANPSNPSSAPGQQSQLPPSTIGFHSHYIIADVSAQLPLAVGNDQRAMLQMINHLVSELKKEKSFDVQLVQLPFDVESGKTIKGSAEASTAQTDAPKFSFRIVQGL